MNELRRQAITADMNLAVLRRQDSTVEKILCSSSHVAVYGLPVTEGVSGQWERLDIEGSLFVVSRSGYEDGAAHRVIVINRKSPENFIDDITPGQMQFDIKEHMILFANAQGKVTGLWFFVADDVQRIYEVMTDVANASDQAVAGSYVLESDGDGSQAAGSSVQCSPGKTKKKSRTPPHVDMSSESGAGDSKQSPVSAANHVLQDGEKTSESLLSLVSGKASGAKPIASQNLKESPREGEKRNSLCQIDDSVPRQADVGTIIQERKETTRAEESACSLHRFFPNLRLTNGVAGTAPPLCAITTAKVVEESSQSAENEPSKLVACASAGSAENGHSPQSSQGQSPSAEGGSPVPSQKIESLMVASNPAIAMQIPPPPVNAMPHFLFPYGVTQNIPVGIHSSHVHHAIHARLSHLLSQSAFLTQQQQHLMSKMVPHQQMPDSEHGTSPFQSMAEMNDLHTQLQIVQQQQSNVQHAIAQVQHQLTQQQVAIPQNLLVSNPGQLPLGSGIALSRSLPLPRPVTSEPVVAQSLLNGNSDSARASATVAKSNSSETKPEELHAGSQNSNANVAPELPKEGSSDAANVGVSISLLSNRLNSVGSDRGLMDRAQFKGFLQRLLTDRRLFDQAFMEYSAQCSRGTC